MLTVALEACANGAAADRYFQQIDQTADARCRKSWAESALACGE